MMQAAPARMTARSAISPDGEDRGERRDGEHRQTDEQNALAAVLVTQRAGRQQQPGEHHGIGVNDPQLLGLCRTRVARQPRQSNVEHRYRRDDDRQRGAHHDQDQPAARRADLRRLARRGCGAHRASFPRVGFCPGTRRWVRSTPTRSLRRMADGVGTVMKFSS